MPRLSFATTPSAWYAGLGIRYTTAGSEQNPRPTPNLRLERGPTQLAFAAEQAFATAIDDQVHVVAQDPGQRVHHVVLDAQGRSGPLHELPLAAPTGIVACASAVFVTGWTAASTAAIVRIAPDGTAAATEIPATPPLHVWPAAVHRRRAAVDLDVGGSGDRAHRRGERSPVRDRLRRRYRSAGRRG
jgi:hypothetical protein